jgi:hypothetical protein
MHSVASHKVLNIEERVNIMADIRERIDLGTWGMFRTGWWVLHVVGIVVVGYIGYWIATM